MWFFLTVFIHKKKKKVELWKKYIDFEKSNPLRSEDTALVTRRVMFATEQCLLVLTHHPAVWHQAAQYLDQSSKLLTEKGVRTNETTDHDMMKNNKMQINDHCCCCCLMIIIIMKMMMIVGWQSKTKRKNLKLTYSKYQFSFQINSNFLLFISFHANHIH